MQHELSEEREANLMTEAIFFGDGALTAAVSLHGDDEDKLGRHFGVSPESVRIALKKL
jgi:DNA-binding GntR family transcriptional regulator